MNCKTTIELLFCWAVASSLANGAVAQTAPNPPAQTSKPSGAQKSPANAAPAAPQSKHYPILLIASGVNPGWSMRVGMKGAERLERAGYPPITLEPGDITADDSGKAWTYKARDTATNADVTVQLARESCSDGTDAKYSFAVVVSDSEIGELKGCAKIAAEQFPEFKQKNLDDDDPEKKKVVPPPITGFKAPVEIAFIDPAGKVVYARGAVTKIVASAGSHLQFSHDGKKLLFTRDDGGKNHTLLMYDVASGKTTELMRGSVQTAFWSPDDSKIAFLRAADSSATVWTMPANSPEGATQLNTIPVTSLHGWLDAHTVLATDNSNLHFLKTDSPPMQIALRDIYGEGFEIGAADTIRVNPANFDLILISAGLAHTKSGSGSAAFLYEIKSKRRVTVTPASVPALDAEWSRDAIQIFFTNRESAKAAVICRVFWDGSGYKRIRGGSDMVVGQ
jgi:uncharacterized membrane protein